MNHTSFDVLENNECEGESDGEGNEYLGEGEEGFDVYRDRNKKVRVIYPYSYTCIYLL